MKSKTIQNKSSNNFSEGKTRVSKQRKQGLSPLLVAPSAAMQRAPHQASPSRQGSW